MALGPLRKVARLVSKRRVALGPKHTRCLLYGAMWAHIDSALGPDAAQAATTCDAARYAGKCSAAKLWCGQCTSRRAVSATGPDDACTDVNIIGAGATGHAQEATKQRQLNTVRNLHCAVGAGQRTSRWVPSGEADSGATSPSRALGRATRRPCSRGPVGQRRVNGGVCAGRRLGAPGGAAEP